jgi:hypothetical protein
MGDICFQPSHLISGVQHGRNPSAIEDGRQQRQADAIDWLYDAVKNNGPITQGLMKEINALLLSGVKFTPAMDETGQKVQKPANP